MMRKTNSLAVFCFTVASALLFYALEKPFLSLRNQWVAKSLQNAPCIVQEQYPAEPLNRIACPSIKVKYTNTRFPIESLVRLPCVEKQSQLTFLENYPVGKSLTCWYLNGQYSAVENPALHPSYSYPQNTKFENILIIIGCFFLCCGLIIVFFSKKKPLLISESIKKPLLIQKNPAWKNLLLLVVGLLFLFLSYRLFQREWYVIKHFQETSCTVLDKKIIEMTTSSSKRSNTKTLFYLSYTVNQTIYHEWRSPTLTESSNNVSFNLPREYQNGKSYSCWYDPNDPKTVVLERGNFTPILIIFGMSILFILSSVAALISQKRKK